MKVSVMKFGSSTSSCRGEAPLPGMTFVYESSESREETQVLRFKYIKALTVSKLARKNFCLLLLYRITFRLKYLPWEALYRWSQAYCAGASPSPRSSHAAVILADTLLVGGGQSQGQVFSDAYILCLVTLTWREASPSV